MQSAIIKNKLIVDFNDILIAIVTSKNSLQADNHRPPPHKKLDTILHYANMFIIAYIATRSTLKRRLCFPRITEQ